MDHVSAETPTQQVKQQEDDDLRPESKSAPAMTSNNNTLLNTSSAVGAELCVEPPLSIAPSHPTSTSFTHISSPAALTPNVKTQIEISVPYDKPQRSIKPKPQFVEQYGPTRLSDYHSAYCFQSSNYLSLFIKVLET